MEQLKPEAAYFFEQEGDRECIFVINLDVSAMLKPLFPGLDPSVFVTPVVNAAEFQAELGPAGPHELLEDLKPVSIDSRRSKPGDGGTESPGARGRGDTDGERVEPR